MKFTEHFHAFFSISLDQTLNFIDKLMAALWLMAIDFENMMHIQKCIVFFRHKVYGVLLFYCPEIGSNCPCNIYFMFKCI